MKKLNKYIIERLSTDDMKGYLLRVLSSDKLSDDILFNAYKAFAKDIGDTDKISIWIPDEKAIKAYLKRRNISEVFFIRLIRLFKEYDLIPVLNGIVYADGIKNSNSDNINYPILKLPKLPLSEDAINLAGGDIIEYFSNYIFDVYDEQFKLPKELLFELAGMTKQAIGDFEVLCDLFIKDIIKAPRGDVNTEKLGQIEFKCNGGRIMAKDCPEAQRINKTYASEMSKFTDNLGSMPKNGYFTSGKNGDYIKIQTDLMSNIKMSLNDCSEVIIKSYLSQYVDYNENTKSIQFDQSTINKLIDFIKINKIIFGGPGKISIDNELLRRFIGCIQLYFYHNEDKWNYMMVFADKKSSNIVSGKYTIIDGTKIGDDIYNAINYIYNIKEIKFSGWPKVGSGTSAQDRAVQIHLVK